MSVDRDDRSFGRDRNRDSDKTDTDWRARPATDSFWTTCPEERKIVLETSFEVTMIQTHIMVCIEIGTMMAHTGTRADRGDHYND